MMLQPRFIAYNQFFHLLTYSGAGVLLESTGSLLDIASELLKRRPRASLIVLGSNAQRNVLEQERDGCSALFGLKGDLHDHHTFEGRIDRIKGDRFDDSSRWRQFHKPCRISIFPFSRLPTDGLFGRRIIQRHLIPSTNSAVETMDFAGHVSRYKPDSQGCRIGKGSIESFGRRLDKFR